jgi:hypothetical protein
MAVAAAAAAAGPGLLLVGPRGRLGLLGGKGGRTWGVETPPERHSCTAVWRRSTCPWPPLVSWMTRWASFGAPPTAGVPRRRRLASQPHSLPRPRAIRAQLVWRRVGSEGVSCLVAAWSRRGRWWMTRWTTSRMTLSSSWAGRRYSSVTQRPVSPPYTRPPPPCFTWRRRAKTGCYICAAG